MADPYFSEIKYRGHGTDDFAEIAVDAGTDPSTISVVVYHSNGGVKSVNGLGTLDNTMFGKDIYTVDTAIHRFGAIALVENGVVISFVSFDGTVSPTVGPAAGMTSTQIGSVGNSQTASLQSTGDGNYTSGSQTEGSIPCFLRGTMIATAKGERAVEDLSPGDRIVVRDTGLAPLRWLGSVTADAHQDFEANAPICIPRGALGRGLPVRDLYVSPNHRIWMKDASYEIFFESREVLIPAKHLAGWGGIKQVDYIPEPEYFHLLFDRHEIVISDGLPTESLFPERAQANRFDAEASAELRRLFPALESRNMPQTLARRCLRSYEVGVAMEARGVA